MARPGTWFSSGSANVPITAGSGGKKTPAVLMNPQYIDFLISPFKTTGMGIIAYDKKTLVLTVPIRGAGARQSDLLRAHQF